MAGSRRGGRRRLPPRRRRALIDAGRLARLEAVVDRCGVAARIEALLPVGPRPRQLSVRTLLVGMLASQADGRPAHLIRVRQALCGLGEADRVRLGVVADWKAGPHGLTYRQVEYTFSRVCRALAKDSPDGAPSEALSGVLDDLLESSIADRYRSSSSSVAVDWTDQESFSRPPDSAGGPCADAEASWGHRRGHGPGADELFFGYYLSTVVMVKDEGGGAVPELIRRLNLTTASIDPVPALVPVVSRMVSCGVVLGDVLADSGYSYRVAQSWAGPLRAMGAALVVDLHPNDRGPHGTFAGAIAANGNLYCPAIPKDLLSIGPLPRGADASATAAHDKLTAEAARYKLSPLAGPDDDGFRRLGCPAVAGKLRCSRRPESMALDYDRPTVAHPPDPAPTCCEQKTITVPPTVNAKTAQKHDYPGPAWRSSYARRSGVERGYATLKDPASNDVTRGWCRLMGLAPIVLFLAAVAVVRNQRVTDAFEARQADDADRLATARPVRVRRGRRGTRGAVGPAPPP